MSKMLNTVCLWRFELSWWFRVTRSSAAKRVARQKKPLIYGVYPLPEAFDSPLTNGNNTIKADRANLSAAMGRQVGLFCRWIKSGAQCALRWNSHINYECAPYPRADEAAISPTFIKAQIPSLLAPNSDRSSLHYTVSLKVYLHFSLTSFQCIGANFFIHNEQSGTIHYLDRYYHYWTQRFHRVH